jgi:hypothetical protein
MNGVKKRTAWHLLIAVMFLVLVLALLPGTAFAQTAPPDAAAAPAAPAAAVDCTDSTLPGPAQRFFLARDDEVGVLYQGTSDNPNWWYYDYSNGALTSPSGNGTGYALDSSWMRGTRADLNGDGYDEFVYAYRNDGASGELEVNSVVWHPGIVNVRDVWQPNTGRLTGGEVSFIDVAAGNLSRNTSGTQQVVIAASNHDHDLEMIILTGDGSGNLWPDSGLIPSGGQYHHMLAGQDTVHHVAVATGDLNGDGYKDEIVTAFSDSDGALQVLVTRWKDGAWSDVAQYRFTDAATAHNANSICKSGDYHETPKRGLDVTTGDVNGDSKDEVIVGFVDNGNWVQVVQMGLVLNDPTQPFGTAILEDQGYYRHDEDTTELTLTDPDYISIAAPDLNGDGIDEITVGIGGGRRCYTSCGTDDPVVVWRLSSPLKLEGSSDNPPDQVWVDSVAWNADDYNYGMYLDIEAANVDKDPQEEAVLAFATRNGSTYKGDIAMRVLKMADGANLSLVASGYKDSGRDDPHDVSVLTGDYNLNSSRLTYTNVCKTYGQTALSTVVNLPPQWHGINTSNNGVGAAYGQSVAGGVTTGKTNTYSYGASVTIDGSVTFLDIFEAGPKYTAEFEGSHSVTKEQSVSASTTLANASTYGDDSAYGFVVEDAVNYRAYKYTESTTGKATWSRIATPQTKLAPVMEAWNSWNYLTGWLPIGLGPRINLAQGKTASMSSTYPNSAASRANDGDTDGNGEAKVAHTNSELNPWWQVDLGTSQPIESVTVWNRTDGSGNRLANWVVKTSADGSNWTWTSAVQTGTGGPTFNVPVGKTARFVRIQLNGTNFLHLAEVQVWKETRVDLALGKTASQSSTYTANGVSYGADRAVDGNTDGNFANGSVSHTNSELNPWWQVDLGTSQLIGSVDVWNRTDCCGTRLSNWVVKVSDTGTDWDNPKWTSATFTQAAGSPTYVRVAQTGRYVRVQILGTNSLHMAEVQVWKARQVPDYPKGIYRTSDKYFTITNQDGTTAKVPGDLMWDWCSGYLADNTIKSLVTTQQPIPVYRGTSVGSWNITTAFGNSQTWADSWGINASFGMEAKVMGVGVEYSYNFGFNQEKSKTVDTSKETYFEGSAGHFPDPGFPDKNYKYCPYYYATNSTTADGTEHAYIVLDYYVPCIGSSCGLPSAPVKTAPAPTGPAAIPQPPVIESATHPDPNAWSPANVATFTWHQPAGDTNTGLVYRWFLDQQADTIPEPPGQGEDQTYTYYDLTDGTWYMHVRAMNTDGAWSDTATRQIRIDRQAPVVTLTRDPATPDGNQDWYRSPVTVTATVSETGSGLVALEVSTDGTTWQPYAGALHYTGDTPPATIWARASDNAGHVSQPIVTTVKVDMTAPNSHVDADCGIWGACQAGIVVDAMGNEHLVLAGQIHESTSGRAGMQIQADDSLWTSAGAYGEWHPFPGKPAVTTNWVYTGTLELGHGYHIFNGRASDGAGNVETPYKIAEVVWYPLASPDLSASSLRFEPAVVRPGDTVAVILTARNGGQQEAHVAISTTLPSGLAPAEGALTSIDGSITYDPATRIATWPAVLLWPGETRTIEFRATIAQGVAAGTLTGKLDLHGFWPNTELLADPAMRQRFLDKEVAFDTTAGLQVDPALPASRDVTAPHVRLTVADGELAAGAGIRLTLHADSDATRLFLREWTLDPVSGAWIVAQDSGWRSYAESLDWQLTETAGVHYLGAWVADAAFNVSALDEDSLAFTNLPIEDTLAAGQRRQYRFTLSENLALFNVLSTSGLADLDTWLPGFGQYPAYAATGSAALKALAFQSPKPGVHLLEVVSTQDGAYTLLPAAGVDSVGARAANSAAALPNHPLTMSTPLTGGAGGAPGLTTLHLYLPVVGR